MKLGILVNTDKHLDDILGITKASLSKGHEVTIFHMDEGTKLLGDPSFADLCKTEGVTMSFCDHSAKGLNVSTEGIPADISCGSQFDNANMNHDCDKVIIL
jgi:predicted peroxiredoxin